MTDDCEDYDDYDDEFSPGDVDENPDIPHLDEFHAYLAETRDVGEPFMSFGQWHMQEYGNFGNS